MTTSVDLSFRICIPLVFINYWKGDCCWNTTERSHLGWA